MSEQWLTVAETATLLKVTPWTIRDWVRRGILTGQLFGRRTMRVWMDDGRGGEGHGVQGQETTEVGAKGGAA